MDDLEKLTEMMNTFPLGGGGVHPEYTRLFIDLFKRIKVLEEKQKWENEYATSCCQCSK